MISPPVIESGGLLIHSYKLYQAPALAAGLLLTLISSTVGVLGQATGQIAGPESEDPSAERTVVLAAVQLPQNLAIQLDGRLDDQAWSMATPVSDFLQQEPVEGAVPSERTEVRILFDEDELYIGVMLYDDPDGILAYQKLRDASLGSDDRFMWILDTFLDGRTGYFFEINAAGLMGDGLLSGGSSRGGGGGRGGGGFGGGSSKAWDGIWEARTEIRPDGWSAEIRIPFRTLNFDPDNDSWGINFQRTIRRRNEEILWRGWRRTEGLRRPIYAGRLTGLNNLSQGIGLEARPSTIVGWRTTPANTDPTTIPRDLSLDINYSLTSSLRASLSVNTDFAEVESDRRRVNLTRFPIRFPERRDFFLEGSSVFSFAPRSGPSPFYSRTVGLSGGRQIPITYGLRTSGQVGQYEVGFYQLGTGQEAFMDGADQENVVPSEQFTVARIKRRIFEQSTIGAIYTRRATSPDPSGFAVVDRHTAGLDLAFSTRNLAGNSNMETEAFVIWNSNPDPTEDRTFENLSAHGLRINFPNDTWSGHLSYRQFGDSYRPALGFVTRNDFRRLEPRIGWSPRPDIDWLRKIDFSAQFRHQEELGTGITEEQEWDFGLLGLDFETGDGINFNAKRTFEYLDRSFFVSEGIEITEGEYTSWEYRVIIRTAGRRRISMYGGFTVSEFWNGDRQQFGGRITFRPNPGISIATNIQHNQVTLPQGQFSADLYEIEGQWNPTPWVGATTQLQYDDVTDVAGLFARLRWIMKPGNDLYLVYTHNWRNLETDLLDRHFQTLSRGGSVKVNYTYRL